ncbi:putative NAD-dependent histone deacetylase sirtuin-1 [Blattamonas nauphoetae]|uniref:NAD-dependent histone deacetylase sirtuin-1 n=1 Tax=Blattamonas nauphoetae TaxID=2049346 RepID=A0ABQ9YJM4_9EUKA|nr:putative NAD-dependent histone deacetylase sirtuin-1 [Blattamonas nauphoetae]
MSEKYETKHDIDPKSPPKFTDFQNLVSHDSLEAIRSANVAFDKTTFFSFLRALAKPEPRQPIQNLTTHHHAIDILTKSHRILVIVGAESSSSTMLSGQHTLLSLQQELRSLGITAPEDFLSLKSFLQTPENFFSNAYHLIPAPSTPTSAQNFVSKLCQQNRVIRVYSQNTDGGEESAGISDTIFVNGCLRTSTCQTCRKQVRTDSLRHFYEQRKVAFCSDCQAQGKQGLLKPDITFIGESVPEAFFKNRDSDAANCDLVLVVGSSLQQRDIISLLADVPPTVPRILIGNKIVGPKELPFDIYLIGEPSQVCEAIETCMSATEPDTKHAYLFIPPNVTNIFVKGDDSCDVVFNFSDFEDQGQGDDDSNSEADICGITSQPL